MFIYRRKEHHSTNFSKPGETYTKRIAQTRRINRTYSQLVGTMVTPATGGGEAGDRDASSAPTGSDHQNKERTGPIANSNARNKDLTDVEVEQLFKYIDTILGEDAQTVMSIDVNKEERAAALKRIMVYGPRMTGYYRKLKEEREQAKAWLPEGGSEAGNAITGGKRQLDRIERAVTRVEARVAAPTPTPLTQTRT